jgi:hypothetical protein
MTKHVGKRKVEPEKRAREENSLHALNLNAAGIDVGSEEHWVAVPKDRDDEPVKKFGCFTADLHAMAQWLKKCGITTVAMESTGVYWIPLHQILEHYGFEVRLVNASHVKNAPVARVMSRIAGGSSSSTPSAFFPVPSVRTTRSVYSVRTGDTGRTWSAMPPTISATCRRPSPR